jgi:hypothetical protein
MQIQQSIDSAQALYRKLERTFDRRVGYGNCQVDWVFDFAVTGWHLVDWISAETDTPVGTTQEILKLKCAELAVCEQICNGAKHLKLDNPRLKPFDVATDVRNSGALSGIRTNVYAGDTAVDITLTLAISITDNEGKSWDSIELFRRILAFWRTELGVPD